MCPYLYLPVLPTAVCRCQGAARASFLLDEKKSGDLLDLILIRFEWKRLVCSPSSPVCCTFHSHLTSYCVRVPTVSGCLHMQANGLIILILTIKGLTILLLIIKGLSLQRACLQPATSTHRFRSLVYIGSMVVIF